jgi:hypothetical protein
VASPASAIHDGEAHAWSESVSGEGALLDAVAQLLETGRCNADFTNGGPLVTNDQCTESIGSSPADAVVRFATANVGEGSATSSAEAAVAEVPLTDFTQLDLPQLFADLGATSPNSSALEPLFTALGCLAAPNDNDPATCPGNGNADGPLFPLVDGLNGPLQQALLALQDNLLELDLVAEGIFATCSATANTATGNSGVADLRLTADLGGQEINVPLDLVDASHYRPVANPSLLVNEIIFGDDPAVLNDGGVQETLNTSLGAALAALDAAALQPVGTALNQILTGLEDALLVQLEDALRDLIELEINHTTANAEDDHVDGPWSEADETEVTAFRLTLLQGGGQQAAQTVRIGRVHCGDNVAGTTHTAGPPDRRDRDDNDDNDDSDDGGDDDDDDSPKSISSGMGAGGNLSAAALSGLMAMTAMSGTIARRRRIRI